MRDKPVRYRVIYLQERGRRATLVERSRLDLAERDLRSLKRQGRTAWIETSGGEFVPVKGAMRKPAEVRNNRRAKKNARRQRTGHRFHATPYDVSKSGFYFDDADDFDDKYKKHLPTEEYEIQWIDGPEGDRELFEALNVHAGNIGQYLELVEELELHEKAALYYLLRHRGMGRDEDLDDLLTMVRDEVRVREGNSVDYVYELVDDLGWDIGENNMQMYFDYESFGRDLGFDLDPDDPDDQYYLDMSDRERGEEYVESVGWEGIGKNNMQQYFDAEAFARDMEYNGEIHEFDFDGQTYTTDFTG